MTLSLPPPSSLPLAFVHPQAMRHGVAMKAPRNDKPKSTSAARAAAAMALVDDELLFQMSPVVSPKHSAFFDFVDKTLSPSVGVVPPAQQTLTERWDIQAEFMLGTAKQQQQSQSHQQQKVLDSSSTNSLKPSSSSHHQHHRVRSALVVGAHSDVPRCSTKDGRTRFDCADCCCSPTTSEHPRSPPNVRSSKRKPFLYTFPTFDNGGDAASSVPTTTTLPMPIHRVGGGVDPRSVFGSSPELTVGAAGGTMGPIRARNLRIQSRTSVIGITSDELASVHGSAVAVGREDEDSDRSDEDEDEQDEDDGGFIPGTFGSDALDDDFDHAHHAHTHRADAEDAGYAISQPCSSSASPSSSCGSFSSAMGSSESGSNGTEFDGSDVLPKSLLASFPVRRASPPDAEHAASGSLSVSAEEARSSGAGAGAHSGVGLPRSRSARFFLGGGSAHSKRVGGPSSFSARKME